MKGRHIAFAAPLLLVLLSAISVCQAGPTPTPCDNLIGQARGLCMAGTAVGCGDPLTSPPGCTRIEQSYLELTGEVPPWASLPPCPCGTSEEFLKMIDGAPFFKDELACTDVKNSPYGNTLSIGDISNKFYGYITSYYPNSQVGKQTCGFNNTSLYSMTDMQARSCIREIQEVVDAFGLKCATEYPTSP